MLASCMPVSLVCLLLYMFHKCGIWHQMTACTWLTAAINEYNQLTRQPSICGRWSSWVLTSCPDNIGCSSHRRWHCSGPGSRMPYSGPSIHAYMCTHINHRPMWSAGHDTFTDVPVSPNTWQTMTALESRTCYLLFSWMQHFQVVSRTMHLSSAEVYNDLAFLYEILQIY